MIDDIYKCIIIINDRKQGVTVEEHYCVVLTLFFYCF